MTYTVPRPLYEVLAENLKDRKAADDFARSIEEAVLEISRMAEKETIEKTSVIKMEIKEDLAKTLVTRELFETEMENIDHRFHSMQDHMDLRFKHMDFKFNILIGISLLGFTLLNPAFIDLIKMFIK